MALALGWWTILLYQKVSNSYEIQTSVLDKSAPSYAEDLAQHAQEYQRELVMIIGEGIVFVIILGLGLYLINRAYHKEIEVAYQKRNFLLSITHELKSPLAGIKLAFETLKKHKLEKNKEIELIDAAIDENNRLNKLVNNLLLAAKVEKEYFVEKELIHFNAVIEEVIESYQFKYPDFKFKFIPSELPAILFDREGVYSIIHNLIDNSIKYSIDKKEIEISTRMHNHNIELQVADQGIGIPENEHNHVFEQFYRVGSEDTRTAIGTGLGLYIVQKIVRAHKGIIQIFSNKPNGSIFKIKLPIITE
jgi:signal transduction histidine kinase